MAIYERAYRAYAGPLTPEWSRFLVLPRYAFEAVFSSKLFTAFFALCFVPSLVGAVLVYLHHNAKVLTVLEIRPDELIVIDGTFFLWLLTISSLMLGFLLTLLVGPGLISRDLLHDALPLYLSRPFSRAEYVAGKMAVLILLQSAVSWLPLLLVWTLKASLDPAWAGSNLRIVPALVVGGLLWIVLLSLLALAISATVKRRILAQATLVGFFFILAAFGGIVNVILGTSYGAALALSEVIQRIWAGLFGVAPLSSNSIPLPAAWASALAFALLCLRQLARKVRAHEVVT
jgi:ABC-2 type transport system permease protein